MSNQIGFLKQNSDEKDIQGNDSKDYVSLLELIKEHYCTGDVTTSDLIVTTSDFYKKLCLNHSLFFTKDDLHNALSELKFNITKLSGGKNYWLIQTIK